VKKALESEVKGFTDMTKMLVLFLRSRFLGSIAYASRQQNISAKEYPQFHAIRCSKISNFLSNKPWSVENSRSFV